VRRKPALLVILLGFGALSRTAVRHEALFVIAATGPDVSVALGSASARADAWLLGRFWRAGAVLSLVYLLAGASVYRAWVSFGHYFQTYGYGSLEMAAGAAAFLDREGISGPMFNTYDLGSNLEYHGRKVFVDTRNSDYGYAFLRRTLDAANDKDTWNGLDREYHFTHAVLWYAPWSRARRFLHPPPRTRPGLGTRLPGRSDGRHLKRTVENAGAIARHECRMVTPLDLYSGDVIARTPRAGFAELQQELIRLAAADPDSIQARLLLARSHPGLSARGGADAAAGHDGDRAARLSSARAPRGVVRAAGEVGRRGREFETAIDLAGVTAARFDYNYVAEVFEKAGDPVKAAAYPSPRQLNPGTSGPAAPSRLPSCRPLWTSNSIDS
jgi:hypothetical protein